MHKTRQTIVNWEKGKLIPDFRTLYTLSGLYGIPMDAFFLPSEST
nr:MAG TPA: helix-turn-helix protein [Caudoviricetes sp.]